MCHINIIIMIRLSCDPESFCTHNITLIFITSIIHYSFYVVLFMFLFLINSQTQALKEWEPGGGGGHREWTCYPPSADVIRRRDAHIKHG